MPTPTLAPALLSVFLFQGVAFAAATTTSPTTAPAVETVFDATIAALADPDVSRRVQAQRELLAIGDDLLPTLQPALQAARKRATDPDVQLRLDTLLVQIQDRVDVGGSRLTLRFNNAPLGEVLEALTRQARVNFSNASEEFAGENAPRVTLDLHNASFWTAIDQVQEKASVMFLPQGDTWRVTRNFAQQAQVRGSESGAFLVQPVMSTYQRNIAYSRNMGGGEYFTLQFQMLCEPKIRLANAPGMLQVDRAVDSNGNDLLAQQRTQQVSTGNGQSAIGCSVQLKYPANAGETFAEVSGTLRISIARRVEVITTADLFSGGKLEATVDGATITIEPVNILPGAAPEAEQQAQQQQRPNSVTLTVIIQAQDGAASISRLTQSVQQIRITDERGTMLRLTGSSPVRTEPQRTELKMTFSGPQQQSSQGPYKLRLEVPSGYREVEVPFLLRDLKMP